MWRWNAGGKAQEGHSGRRDRKMSEKRSQARAMTNRGLTLNSSVALEFLDSSAANRPQRDPAVGRLEKQFNCKLSKHWLAM